MILFEISESSRIEKHRDNKYYNISYYYVGYSRYGLDNKWFIYFNVFLVVFGDLIVTIAVIIMNIFLLMLLRKTANKKITRFA